MADQLTEEQIGKIDLFKLSKIIKDLFYRDHI